MPKIGENIVIQIVNKANGRFLINRHVLILDAPNERNAEETKWHIEFLNGKSDAFKLHSVATSEILTYDLEKYWAYAYDKSYISLHSLAQFSIWHRDC